MSELETMADKAYTFAKTASGPFIIGWNDEEEFMIDLSEMFTNEYEQVKHRIIKSLLLKLKASAYVLVFEAWTVNRPIEEGTRISEQDDRIEVLLVTGQTKRGESLNRLYRILPDRVFSDEYESLAIGEGRLANLLNDAASASRH